uniref:Serine-rich coiled-coil domain-containing protein 1 isoform X2 n=1 Tax=Pogona vitticeps TaxID=103695 RepID=A0ABM5GK69_9SAUR
MGESGSRRSIIVSRLPIFRRSISRRRDSLPSSPTSNSTVGVHSSSPSSTNSSSGSTGKRRSLFRTPSISFHHKKGSEQKVEPQSQNVGILNGAQSSHSNTLQKLNLEEHVKSRGRHSVGFGGSRNKKITRSLTEDFEKGREASSNKNVFINCIRSGKNESDDSGFTEEQSRSSSVKHSSRKLLPKSFSTHYRFSKPVPQSQSICSVQPPSCSVDVKTNVDNEAALAATSPSGSAEVIECIGSSSQSPMLSTDLTTVQTPSEFLALTEDSVSEVDGLPNYGNLHPETFTHNGSTSQIFLNPVTAAPVISGKTDRAESASHYDVASPESHRARRMLLREASTVPESLDHNRNCAKVLLQELPANQFRHQQEVNSGAEAQLKPVVLKQGEITEHSPNAQRSHRDQEEIRASQHIRETIPPTESMIIPLSSEPQSFQMQQGYEMNHAKVNLASSFSPYREGRFIEKRLRSSSEGTAGSSRMILKPKDSNPEELNSLRKQRTSSSSSKMNSMDVLNNLGSCDLDEDDLMLDLEFLEEQHHCRSVCREDSHQSIVSCAAVLLTPIESAAEGKKKEQPKMPEVTKQNLSLKLSKEVDRGETRCSRVSQLASSPSVEWPFPAMEEGGGMESLPFRLMMQDCTAVKTLLLKMKRVLQEDIMKDECSSLKLQLKERDELISQLREELEKAQHLQSALVSQADKSTQTELVGHDATLLNKMVSQTLNIKDRKSALTPTEDHFRHPPGNQATSYESKSCQLSNVYLSNLLKEKEIVEVIKHTRDTYESLASEVNQNGLAGETQGVLKPSAKAENGPVFSGALKDQTSIPRQHSTFIGRLGQPPRGPISLHMYSRKNVFLHHNLHTSELQTLGQQDG